MFEQSGTFKNEFIKLGIPSFDYDTLNEFGQTDYKVDLFEEIDNAFVGADSVFDSISSDDLIFAFFPCTKFEDQALLGYRCDRWQLKNYSILQKLSYVLKQHEELNRNYSAITELVYVCVKKNVPLIIENPYSTQHYLQRYWCLKPQIVDMDRREDGDYYRKPTQYWFIGCEPKQNIVFEPIDYVETESAVQRVCKKDGISREVRRSLIHPQYANRFIRKYILEGE